MFFYLKEDDLSCLAHVNFYFNESYKKFSETHPATWLLRSGLALWDKAHISLSLSFTRTSSSSYFLNLLHSLWQDMHELYWPHQWVCINNNNATDI